MIIGALCLVLLPLDYRAGAALSHPHSILQLLYDVAHGSLTHHVGDAGAEHRHPNVAHDHGLVRLPADVNLAQPPGNRTERASPQSPAAVIAALRKLTPEPAPSAETGDDPTLSPRSAPGKYVVYSLALPVAALLAWHWFGRRLTWPLTLALRGLSLAPEPPPPRVVAQTLRDQQSRPPLPATA